MNLSRTTLIALFIIAISYSVYAQEITYRSTLKNNKGVPIDYATVVLLNSNAQAITVTRVRFKQLYREPHYQ